MHTPTAPSGAPSRTRGGRFTSPKAEIEEDVVEHQAEMDELAIANVRVARNTLKEMQEDETDDRRRFTKYQAVERAISVGDTKLQLLTFHELVAHVEADEYVEDKRRHGRVSAERTLAGKALHLRRIFRDDFVPLIRAAAAQGGRS